MMKAMRKSRVSLALGIALGAAALVPATASAASVDIAAGGALVNDDRGDGLLFPLYTTAIGAGSSFSVTNTSPSDTVIAKIRFREQERSMDVLDFIVALSPRDKFDFFVVEPDGSRPVMHWNDNSCVVGPGVGNTTVQFPAPSAFVDSEDAMSLGHLEVLGMMRLTGSNHAFDVNGNGVVELDELGNLAAAAEHDSTGMPANCNLIVDAFEDQSSVDRIFTDGATIDVDNVLIGRFLVTGTGVGVEGGSNAISLRNVFTNPAGYRAAQSPETCNPVDTTTCTGAEPWAWDNLEWDHPHFGDMGAVGVAAMDAGLTALSLQADWSNNVANFVGVDWIVAFPTKYTYLDIFDCDANPATPDQWCLVNYIRPNPFNLVPTDVCLDNNDLNVWDREEQPASGTVSVSPGSVSTINLCNETNVFTIAETGDAPRDSLIQTADRRLVVNFENLPAVRGWADFGLNWVSPGAATIGFAFTTRATDDPTINNGSITDLSKTNL